VPVAGAFVTVRPWLRWFESRLASCDTGVRKQPVVPDWYGVCRSRGSPGTELEPPSCYMMISVAVQLTTVGTAEEGGTYFRFSCGWYPRALSFAAPRY